MYVFNWNKCVDHTLSIQIDEWRAKTSNHFAPGCSGSVNYMMDYHIYFTKFNAYLFIVCTSVDIMKRKMCKLQHWLVANRKVRKDFISSLSIHHSVHIQTGILARWESDAYSCEAQSSAVMHRTSQHFTEHTLPLFKGVKLLIPTILLRGCKGGHFRQGSFKLWMSDS